MAGRSRDTYKKRQKEIARSEKAREKAARRLERKLHPPAADDDTPSGDAAPSDDTAPSGETEEAGKTLLPTEKPASEG